MDQWFSKPASTEKKPEDSDTTTITMDWVLELPKAKAAYDELMDESLWSVPNGNPPRRPIDRLCDKLSDGGYLTSTPKTFSFEDPVWKMKNRLLDNRVIRNGAVFIFDKWGAALGVFELLSFVEGDVRPLPDGSHEVTIRKKGVLMEDQYDFEGGQYFGYWNIEKHTASLLPNSPFPPCTRWVDNGSFRAWRQMTNLGGDYLIYSDLKQIDLVQPYVFYCPTRF
jgi:hypothetical protein